MTWIAIKYLITAGLVVFISEVAKRSDKLGALIASLPLVTILTMLWLYFENQSNEKISNHAYYTFWYVIPTLPMFIAFPFLMPKFGFIWTLIISVFITIISFLIVALLVKKFGIHLV
jgi:hypothetical protein